MRRQPASRCGFTREFEEGEGSVRFARIGQEDGVIEIENVGDVLDLQPALEQGRPEQRRLPQNVYEVKFPYMPEAPRPLDERFKDQARLRPCFSRLVENRCQFRRYK